MKLITSPELTPDYADLFLAGGISNCPDWQKIVIMGIDQTDWTVINPRRKEVFNEAVAKEQITWEYEALHKVSTVVFWFPKETLCPITLFELGVFTQKPDVDLFVGTHPNYARRFDVITQLGLARPEVSVTDNLGDLIQQLLNS